MAFAREEPSGDSQPATPQRRWSWLLFTALLVFLVALITAAPQWLRYAEAWREDVPADQLEAYKRQSELWQRNLSCANAPEHFFVTPKNIKVDATICKSGDIVVQVIPPDSNGRYYWVDLERLSSRAILADLFTLNAYAEDSEPAMVVAQASFVMCQRFLDQRMLLRVINQSGSCTDEVVDTYTGLVQSRNASACRSNC